MPLKKERSWKFLSVYSSYTLSIVVKERAMINILLLMVDKAQTCPVLSQVLPLVWNKICIRGPWGCEFELMAVFQSWIFCTFHTKYSSVWLYLSYLRNPSLHSCRSCMWWLGQYSGAGSGQPSGPVSLRPRSGTSVPWQWLLADMLKVILGALLCYFHCWPIDLHVRSSADDKLFPKSLCARQWMVNRSKIRTTGLAR